MSMTDSFSPHAMMAGAAGMRITEEERKARIIALIREKEGYEARLQNAEDKKSKDQATASIAEVEQQLAAYGHAAAPPSRAAEQRSVASGEAEVR